MGFKIREHTLQRVPYLLVAGDREVAANQIWPCARAVARISGTMSLEDVRRAALRSEVASRGRTVLEE